MKKNKTDLNFWLSVGVANAILIFLTSLLFPMSLVLGNDKVPSMIALLLTALVLTLMLSLVKPVLKLLRMKIKGDLQINIIYGLANMAGLWILARLATLTGFGISSFRVAVILGVVLTIVQFSLWKTTVGKTGRK